MATQSISSIELSRFLNDIELNISDKATDFKKIILYLFKFTNEKLTVINLGRHQIEDVDLLTKLVKTIELVLSKNSYLLNLPISAQEKIIENNRDDILYEWALLYYLKRLPEFQNTVLNEIKSLIINIINLVNNLNNFKFIANLRKLLLKELDTNLNDCFNFKNEKKLILSVHLFTIINDYDISKKLSLNSGLKFENMSRRLWFLCESDDLKSILLLNKLYNVEFSVNWSQISLLLSWIIEADQNSPALIYAISLSLLKIYKICFKKDIVQNFTNSIVNMKCESPLIVKVLHVISCHIDKIDYNEPFTDFELENIRLHLFPKVKQPDNIYTKITSLKVAKYDEYQEIDPNRPSGPAIKEFMNLTSPLLLSNLLLSMYTLFAAYQPDITKLDLLLNQIATNNNRDVRMLITRILPLYLIKNEDPDEIFKKIFRKISSIDFTTKNRRHFGESTIKALVNLAVVSQGERLCAVYFKLIDFLGEANDQHVNYVYCGFLDIAFEKSVPPYKLLSPFLPSIADIIIKKPRVLERILQISNIQKNFFLNRTKDYTVPKLLEYYKAPLIQQIANATNSSVKKLLANNLPRILATYLVKGSNEQYIIKVLSSVDPHYKSITPHDLFTHIGDIIWYILLEIDETNLANINYAIGIVSKYTNTQIDDQVLLLVQKFSDVTLSRSAKPYLEKRNSFNAMNYLIKTHSNAIASALGQISTCLQATIADPELYLLSLKCWYELVNKISSTNLISLIDIIISIVFQKFETFNQEAKIIAVDILRKIYQTILENELNNYSLYYLSIPFLNFKIDFRLFEFKKIKVLSKKQIFEEFNRRLQTSNEYIVKQALYDLFNYCQQYQLNCQEAFNNDLTLSDTITNLIKTVLDTASKFKNSVSTECARILAVIGSLDFNKFNFKSVKKSTIVHFDNNKEICQFLIDLIENYIIKIFWASTDPHRQLFAAYALQSFLKIMDLDLRKFTDVARSTLTPLLHSKYAASKPKIEPIEYPYFKLGMKYETWLVDITLDLLKKASVSDDTKHLIFQTCCILIQKERDVALCEHLLKYVCVEQIHDESILIEFQYIFSLNSKNLSSDKSEVLKSTFQTIFSVFDYLNELGVQEFLKNFPVDMIAIKSAEFDCYERTILYIEKCFRNGQIKDNKLGDLNVSTTLQSMYAGINDFDALNGVLQVFSTTNLHEKLESFQYNQNWTLAHETFHALNAPEKLLKSLNEHGFYDEVLSTLPKDKTVPLEWSLIGLRSAVYTGNSQEVNRWLQTTDSIGKPQDLESLVDYELAKSLKILFEGNPNFTDSIEELYGIIGKSLVSSTSSSFNRNIALMNQLHSIYDIQLIMNDNQEILKSRLENVSQDFDTQRKIIDINNVIYKVLKKNSFISENLLYEASLARENNNFDFATKMIVKAMQLNNKSALFEYSKLLFSKGNQAEAINIVKELDQDRDVQLQKANWQNETNHLSVQQIIEEYNKAIALDPNFQQAYYDLGRYYIKLLENSQDSSGQFEKLIVENLITSAKLGTRFIFETLPKLLSIWLDFAERNNKSKSAEENLIETMNIINQNAKHIPASSWFTVINQLLTRITHSHEPSYKVLAKIISNVTKKYPKQALWFVLNHTKSDNLVKKKRTKQVLQLSGINNLVSSGEKLFNDLILIASKTIKKSSSNKTLSLTNYFNIILEQSFDLVIPTERHLVITIPNGTGKFSSFPIESSFEGFLDKVDVFFSLQMPRRINVKGSDGKIYSLMLKADEVSKDAQVMELLNTIQRLLDANVDSRNRHLKLKPYMVLSLSPNIGIIEFKNNTTTIKKVIASCFNKMNLVFNEKKIFMDIQKLQKKKSLQMTIAHFNGLTKNYKPVLGDYFIANFKNVQEWYSSSQEFSRSNATMAIIGYIIGLGDRHLENILIFENSGGILHIDFDCIYDKGKTLPTPEIVPFRLTQNIVDGFGMTGVEGVFRISAELTMKILRMNENVVLNLLQTYSTSKDQLNTIKRKLQGFVNHDDALPMSVQGQVDVLIQEAISTERLAQMYGGWAAYL
ncbi:unnamed protein product [Candida verbasci]|uniref:Serine/threonine-protein kinase MEC1 n=1 Tax=Candida verbasci TaxID=1227364 RepID=A0A9W4XN50_9ASCO|nr:unnamed protein product [Candida verbasci]